MRNFEFRLPLRLVAGGAGFDFDPDSSRKRKGCRPYRRNQPSAAPLQSLAESSAGGRIADGRLDRTAVAERMGVGRGDVRVVLFCFP